MRWTARLLAMLAAATATVVAARTFAVSRQRPAPVPAIPLDQAADAGSLAARLAEVLRIRTDGDDPASDGSADALARVIGERFPLTAALAVAHDGPAWLFAWPGRSPERPPVVLLAHVDVVSTPDAEAARWAHAPFAGAVADGFVWGRGALDDKGRAVAILAAVESLLRRGVTPARTVYLAFGLDEERGGAGARSVAGRLQRLHPGGLALVLGEGGFVTRGVVPGVVPPVALVGVAEKGYLTLTLTATGPTGHTSAPGEESAIARLSAAVARLERDRPPPSLDGPAAWPFERVASSMSLLPRALYANLWLFRPLVARLAARDPRLAPLTRTTLTTTAIAGGVAENVRAPSATATLNLRLAPGDSTTEAVARVRRALAGTGVEAAPAGSAAEPSAISPPDGAGFRLIERIVRGLAPLRAAHVIVAPSLTAASTDARWFTGSAAEVLRFSPLVVSAAMASGIHGVDERVAVPDLALAVTFYQQVLLGLDALDRP